MLYDLAGHPPPMRIWPALTCLTLRPSPMCWTRCSIVDSTRSVTSIWMATGERSRSTPAAATTCALHGPATTTTALARTVPVGVTASHEPSAANSRPSTGEKARMSTPWLRRRLRIWGAEDPRLAFEDGYQLLNAAQSREASSWAKRDRVLTAVLERFEDDPVARRVALQIVLPQIKSLINPLRGWDLE